jgi:hypothetical protein
MIIVNKNLYVKLIELYTLCEYDVILKLGLLRKSLSKLTYSIKKYNTYLNRYSKSLSNEMVDAIIEKAFQVLFIYLIYNSFG